MIPLAQTAEYAIRAVVEIARRHPQTVRVGALAPVVGAPPNYLAKTLGHLARAGILSSTRGPTGGFRLSESPERLTLHRVVSVFQETGPRRCLLGTGTCGTDPDCPVHARWLPVGARVDAFFRSTTVADLVTTGGDTVLEPLASSSPSPSNRTPSLT